MFPKRVKIKKNNKNGEEQGENGSSGTEGLDSKPAMFAYGVVLVTAYNYFGITSKVRGYLSKTSE